MSDEVTHRQEWRPACMGGWCSRRDRCRHYVEPRRVIVERMCERGQFGHFEPIQRLADLERSVEAAKRAQEATT